MSNLWGDDMTESDITYCQGRRFWRQTINAIVAVLVILVCVALLTGGIYVAVSAGRTLAPPQESERDAFITRLLHETGCGISICGNTFTLNLPHFPGCKTRKEILAAINRIQVPDGCTVRVETVESAITYLEDWMAETQESIDLLRSQL